MKGSITSIKYDLSELVGSPWDIAGPGTGLSYLCATLSYLCTTLSYLCVCMTMRKMTMMHEQ